MIQGIHVETFLFMSIDGKPCQVFSFLCVLKDDLKWSNIELSKKKVQMRQQSRFTHLSWKLDRHTVLVFVIAVHPYLLVCMLNKLKKQLVYSEKRGSLQTQEERGQFNRTIFYTTFISQLPDS